MKKILLILILITGVTRLQAQDLISGGSNSWIFHTPDDGRTTLYIAPKNQSSNWDFSKQTQFLNNGDIITTGRINLPRITGLSSGNLIINAYDGGGGNGYGIEFYAVQNGMNFKTFTGSWASRLYIQDDGKIGVNNSSPSVQFDVIGDIATSGRLITPRVTGNSSGNLIIQGQDIGDGNGYGLEFYAVQNGMNFKTFAGSWASRLYIQDDGKIGIGTTTPDSDALFTVAGSIHSSEVKVLVEAGAGPDYVFEPDYELRTLKETKEYISENKHLPEIPSAREMEANGVDLGDMNMRLLKKIEELTLYQIELLEKLEQQNEQIEELKTSNARIDELEKKLLELTGAEK